MTLLVEISARNKGNNKQQTQQTDIHAFSGIRNSDLSYQEAEDQRFRPHEHRNWRGVDLF
jgi:hypothetical protein